MLPNRPVGWLLSPLLSHGCSPRSSLVQRNPPPQHCPSLLQCSVTARGFLASPCSPSPSDMLEDFVPYPHLSLTAPSLSHILQLICRIFRSFLLPSGKLSSLVLRGAFSAHVLTGSLPCPLPLTTLLCQQSSRAMLAWLRLPVSSPPVFKGSVCPKLLWLLAPLPAPCHHHQNHCRDPARGISEH